jgi:hypothetical protein
MWGLRQPYVLLFFKVRREIGNEDMENEGKAKSLSPTTWYS